LSPDKVACARAHTYFVVMTRPKLNVGTIVMVAALIAIMIAALWFAASSFTALSGPPMPPVGYAAMILGVVLSLVVGCGLMALLFYSSRHGYDEQHPPDERG
jgi:cation transporter-like permease